MKIDQKLNFHAFRMFYVFGIRGDTRATFISLGNLDTRASKIKEGKPWKRKREGELSFLVYFVSFDFSYFVGSELSFIRCSLFLLFLTFAGFGTQGTID